MLLDDVEEDEDEEDAELGVGFTRSDEERRRRSSLAKTGYPC